MNEFEVKVPITESSRALHINDIEEVIKENGVLNKEDLYFPNKMALVFLAYKYSEFESFEKTEEFIHEKVTDNFTQEKLLNTLVKFHKSVDELSRTYKRKELKQALFEWNLRRNLEKGFNDDLPDGICKLITAVLDLKNGENFLNLNAGAFKFAMNIAADNENVSVCGIDDLEDLVYVGNIRSSVIDNRMKVKSADVLNKDFSDICADKVFVNVKCGRINPKDIVNDRLGNFCEHICCKEWAYTVAGILSQKVGGCTVALLPENILTNSADKEVRKKLLESGKIAGVIALHQFAGSLKSLVILSDNNQSVKMLDATEFFTDDMRRTLLSDKDVETILQQYHSESSNLMEVANEKIAENNYILYPPRYLAERKINFEGSPLRKFIKSIKRGVQQIRPQELGTMKSDVPTNCRFVNIQDITEIGISENLLYLKEEECQKYEKNFLSSGDIVISKLSPFKVALIPETDEKFLVSGNLYGLKVADNVNPNWLLLCLKSPQIIMQLNAMASGGISKVINPNSLGEIKIPKTTSDKQNEIAEKYFLLLKELEEVINKSEKIRVEIKNLAFS